MIFMRKSDNDVELNHQETKSQLKLIGIVLLIAGFLIIFFGIVQIFIVFTEPTDWDNFEQQANRQMGQFFIGAILTFVGFVMIGFGFQMSVAGRAGGITKYFARESAPATRIMTEAVAEGFSRGLHESGIGSSRETVKEVIKIRCPHCGYLETEDADYCSKCGKSL